MSKDSIELKPCPFCGSGSYHSHADARKLGHYVYCAGCLTQSPRFDDVQAAIKAWNTRTSPSLEGFDKTVSDAMARYETMTDEQKAEMWKRQREGYVKAELELSASERETTFMQPITRPSPSLEELTGVILTSLDSIPDGETYTRDAAKLIAQAISNYISGVE